MLATDCHTKNHCIKSQLDVVSIALLPTVTQRIIASNHNFMSRHPGTWETVTQRIIASNHNGVGEHWRLPSTVTQRIIASNHNTEGLAKTE